MHSLYYDIKLDAKDLLRVESALTCLEHKRQIYWIRTTPQIKVLSVYHSQFSQFLLSLSDPLSSVHGISNDYLVESKMLFEQLEATNVHHVVCDDLTFFRELSLPQQINSDIGEFMKEWTTIVRNLHLQYIQESTFHWLEDQVYEYNPKIDVFGHYLPFQGITVIANLPYNKLFETLHKELIFSGLGEYYSFLPRESYHVTICNLQVAQKNELQTKTYYNFLRQNQQTIQQLDQKLVKAPKLDCLVTNISVGETMVLIVSFPTQNEYLQDLRTKIQDSTNVDDSQLSFHLTLAYKYRRMSPSTLKKCEIQLRKIMSNVFAQQTYRLEISSPRVHTFNDMTSFEAITRRTLAL